MRDEVGKRYLDEGIGMEGIDEHFDMSPKFWVGFLKRVLEQSYLSGVYKNSSLDCIIFTRRPFS